MSTVSMLGIGCCVLVADARFVTDRIVGGIGGSTCTGMVNVNDWPGARW